MGIGFHKVYFESDKDFSFRNLDVEVIQDLCQYYLYTYSAFVY
jgi:hypothetical protein